MKKNIKNILWLGLSILTFMFFLLAVDKIGLTMEWYDSYSENGWIQYNIILDTIVESSKWGVQYDIWQNIMGLWIAGIVFSTVNIILATCKLGLGFMGKEKVALGLIGDIIMLSAIILSAILTIAGSSLLIDKFFPDETVNTAKFLIKSSVGHYLMLIVPVLLTPIPVLFDKVKIAVQQSQTMQQSQ